MLYNERSFVLCRATVEAVAGNIFNLGKLEHVSPCLVQLHWLLIHYRITISYHTSSALSCTTSISESLRIIWPTLCSLPLPERCAPACVLSLRQTATPHLGCAPSSDSGLFPSPAQRHGPFAKKLESSFRPTSSYMAQDGGV